MVLSASSSSWCLGRAAACDCGTPWTFLVPFVCETWTGPLANSADPTQMPQNAASDWGLHFLLKLQDDKDKMKQSPVPVLKDNRPTSAINALIYSQSKPIVDAHIIKIGIHSIF